MKRYNLFLDDFRIPGDAFNYTKDKDYLSFDWIVVNSYDAFVDVISANFESGDLPGIISFDHDLSDDHYSHLTAGIPYDTFTEKTGYHCAKWFIDFCLDNNIKEKVNFKVHSMNPAGRDNIRSILANFVKHNQTNE